jgi:hypothetical protein
LPRCRQPPGATRARLLTSRQRALPFAPNRVPRRFTSKSLIGYAVIEDHVGQNSRCKRCATCAVRLQGDHEFMRAFAKKITNLMISGVLFFIPLYAIIYILIGFQKQMVKFAKLMKDYFPVDTLVGFAFASITGWLLVIGTLVLLGIFSKMPIARRFSKLVENNILDLIPGYREESQKLRAKLEADAASFQADKQ